MAQIESGKLGELLKAIPPSRVSMLIQSLPGVGVLAQVRAAYPEALEFEATTNLGDYYHEMALSTMLADNPGATVIIDLDTPNPVIDADMNNKLLVFIHKGGQLIIVSKDRVQVSDALLAKLLPIEIV